MLLRYKFIILFACMMITCPAFGHPGHEVVESHSHSFPLTQVLSGVAVIFSLASFWMSWRTRKQVFENAPNS